MAWGEDWLDGQEKVISFPIEGTDLAIQYSRAAHAETTKGGHAKTTESGSFKTSSQWWGGGNFLAKWPQEKLGSYREYPFEKLDQWEDQQAKAILKILWQKLAEDMKAEPENPPLTEGKKADSLKRGD